VRFGDGAAGGFGGDGDHVVHLDVEEGVVAKDEGQNNNDNPTDMRTAWYRKAFFAIAFLLASPALLLVFLLLLLVWLYVGAANVILGFRFLIRMWRCGRFLRRRDFANHIGQSGPGTLIIDLTTLGWGVSDAWWTPDDIQSRAPVYPPRKEDYESPAMDKNRLEWERWCWNEYTNPDNGKALLLRVWNGESLERQLKRRYPAMNIVYTWTALVHMPS